MIRSAALKLTLYYLAILMAVSIGFSLILYQASAREFRRPFGGPEIMIDGRGLTPQQLQRVFDDQADRAAARLRFNLLMLNVLTLLIGSGLSYALALRTLRPIEEAFEAQSRFISDASHELRTPLTAMQTEIEVGLRNPKLKLADSKQLLDSTLDEVKKLAALTGGLLKLTARGEAVPKEAVQLDEIVGEAVEQLKAAARVKSITVQTQLESVTVMGEAFSLKELVVILLDNAIKYSTAQSTITITTAVAGKSAVLRVSDTGQGIKASDLPHIFERFYRADTSRTRQETAGYGLGLSIARQIVNEHGGRLKADSRLGKGSVFTATLPLATV